MAYALLGLHNSNHGKYLEIVGDVYVLISTHSCAQKSVIWSVLLLGVCIVDVSGQTVTFTSSLESTNRTYFCPGEIVTYTCSGVGNEINLYAPPFVSMNFPLSYLRAADSPGSGRGNGLIVSSLISTTTPLMEADLIIHNSSLPELSVHCIVRSTPQEPEAVAQHIPSGIQWSV